MSALDNLRSLVSGTLLLAQPRLNRIGEMYEDVVRGALCAECKERLGMNPIFYNFDTTKRTVHWNCRTVDDDPRIKS